MFFQDDFVLLLLPAERSHRMDFCRQQKSEFKLGKKSSFGVEFNVYHRKSSFVDFSAYEWGQAQLQLWDLNLN